MPKSNYHNQVGLLLSVLPFIAEEKSLALSGGTAINFFIKDMPRLSVDIDLCYIRFDDRNTAIMAINEALTSIKANLENGIPGINANKGSLGNSQDIKLNCQLGRAQIKIEVNTTIRGTIHPVQHLPVAEKVQDEYEKFAAINVLSTAELYAGKICAALDRQHPRDLFDIKLLLNTENITDEIKTAFLAGLLSHSRPIEELIDPNRLDQKHAFENQFSGMTNIEFTYQDYIDTRENLITKLHQSLTKDDKVFLISFNKASPDWTIMPGIFKKLPAIQWKLKNLEKLKSSNPNKHQHQIDRLKRKLSFI